MDSYISICPDCGAREKLDDIFIKNGVKEGKFRCEVCQKIFDDMVLDKECFVDYGVIGIRRDRVVSFDKEKANGVILQKIWDNRFKNLFVCGGSGISKTWCCERTMVYLIKSGLFSSGEVMFVFVDDLFGRSVEDLNNLFKKKFLILDDLGKEDSKKSASVIFKLLLRRLENPLLVTWITSNLNGDEIAERYGDNYGEAIVRRLRDYCVLVTV